MVAGSTLEEVFKQDIEIPIWMPPSFVKVAKLLIEEVSADHPDIDFRDIIKDILPVPKSLESTEEDEFMDEDEEGDEDEGDDDDDDETKEEKLVLINFRLSPSTMYQKLDRRLDE